MVGEKQQTQAEKFQQAARDLGCDDSEQAFDAKLRIIAKQKPKDPPVERKAKRRAGIKDEAAQ